MRGVSGQHLGASQPRAESSASASGAQEAARFSPHWVPIFRSCLVCCQSRFSTVSVSSAALAGLADSICLQWWQMKLKKNLKEKCFSSFKSPDLLCFSLLFPSPAVLFSLKVCTDPWIWFPHMSHENKKKTVLAFVSVLQEFWSWSTSVGCLVSVGHFRAWNTSSTSYKAVPVPDFCPFLLRKMHSLGLSVCSRRGYKQVVTTIVRGGISSKLENDLFSVPVYIPAWQSNFFMHPAFDKTAPAVNLPGTRTSAEEVGSHNCFCIQISVI